jgi:hypothetical protein
MLSLSKWTGILQCGGILDYAFRKFQAFPFAMTSLFLGEDLHFLENLPILFMMIAKISLEARATATNGLKALIQPSEYL